MTLAAEPKNVALPPSVDAPASTYHRISGPGGMRFDSSITAGTLLTRLLKTRENSDNESIVGVSPGPKPGNRAEISPRRPETDTPSITTNNPMKKAIMDQSTLLTTQGPRVRSFDRTTITATAAAHTAGT